MANWGIQNIFSRSSSRSSSSRSEHEQQCTKALENLPNYTILRSGILKFATGDGDGAYDHKVVDVCKLTNDERREFTERVFKVAEDDNGRFLKKIRKRCDKVGISSPTVEVRFEHLTVEADCLVGKRAVPTLINAAQNMIESIVGMAGIRLTKRTHIHILKDTSGVIKPSRLTLLIGPPSSGKTTLLLGLAGRLDPTLKVSGMVTYNGYKLDEFVAQKTAAYVSQNNIHTAELTVRETLDFALRCHGVGAQYDLLSELVKREREAGIIPDSQVDFFMKATATGGLRNNLQTDYILKILGLTDCADTIVGDAMRRGISGGQKKRVTTGEMIVGPMKIFFMDEISVGLDSSTTYQIVKCLQQIVHFRDATILMSLLQPTPDTFDLFDDIILINEGHILYHGPRESVLAFFGSCGFCCPERKSIADFIQEVISRNDQEQYWADHSLPYSYVSAREFANHFTTFHIGAKLKHELSIPFDKSYSQSASLVFKKHTVPYSELLSASFAKEWLLVKRNLYMYIVKFIQIIFVAFIASTVFLGTTRHTNTIEDGNMYIGSLTFALIVNVFNGFSQLVLTVNRLPVFYKHHDLLLFPAWVFTLPNIVLRIPISMLESIVWVAITYYTIGFAPEASRFFKQFLLLFLMQQAAAGLFRLVAAVCRTAIISNSAGSLSVIILFVLAGFILPKGAIPIWWTWGYWISPLTHGFNALAINEFLAPRWMTIFVDDGKPLGVVVLEIFNINPEKKWYWIGVVIYLGYIITLNVLFTVALALLNSFWKSQKIITEAIASELHENENKLKDTSISLQRLKSLIAPLDQAEHSTDENGNIGGFPPNKGMVLPFTPLSISFQEVNYYVDIPTEFKNQAANKDRLQLLSGVTGAFRPKILTALMGISGAGKTTLLDVLAGRKTSGHIEGDIRISGYHKTQATFTRISGYCEQNDIHSPQVTVRESLIYSAFLRLPKEVNDKEKMEFVDEVIGLVELYNLKDSIVGLPDVMGLSTEQRKRLTIAVELVANPSIIFMDEPTSGLDARAAAVVMRTVRNTLDTGRTVVCTIHQPSTEIFEAFDELLLLKRGGHVIFYGPLGQKSREMIDYFEAIPGVPKIKENYNPATWMLEVSSIAAEINLRIDFYEYYKASILYEQTNAMVDELSKPSTGSRDIYFATLYSQSMYGQFKICLWKQWWAYWRSPNYNLVRFLFTAITAFILGSMFWNIGQKRADANDLRTIVGSMFVSIMFIGITNCSTVQSVVAIERTVFYRERAAGMYSALPYALAQVVVEMPYVLVQTLIYILLIYPMMGFQWKIEKFMWFYFISFFSFLYFTYYGMMTLSFSPNQQIAILFAFNFFSIFQLFSGFFIPKPKIPKWWIWYYWICPLAWTVYGLIATQFGDLDDIIEVPGQIKQPIKTYVEEHFGYHREFMIVVAVVLVLFSFVFASTFAFSTMKLNFQKR